MVLVTVNCFTTYSYTKSFHQMWLHNIFSLNTVTKKLFTKNFDEKFSKKKKFFVPRNFPKIFSKKSSVLFPRKVTFCSRESIILFHAKFSRRMNFMLRITFSMENSSRGHAKTIVKNVSFCSRESNILLPRKVTFCSRKSIILVYAKSLDVVTKNLFTKTWLHKICSPKTNRPDKSRSGMAAMVNQS